LNEAGADICAAKINANQFHICATSHSDNLNGNHFVAIKTRDFLSVNHNHFHFAAATTDVDTHVVVVACK
jgi:hypothetical protein